MLDKGTKRIAQHLPRLPASRPASEDPRYSLWRIGERRLEPALECPIGNTGSLIFCSDLEQRVYSRFHRSLAQKIAAESDSSIREFRTLPRFPYGWGTGRAMIVGRPRYRAAKAGGGRILAGPPFGSSLSADLLRCSAVKVRDEGVVRN